MEDPPADSGGGGGGAAAEGPAVQVADICWPTGALPLRLLEWKVKPGSLVNVDSVLALCAPIPQEKGIEGARLPEKKVKSDRAGVVKELCCQLGQVIPPGGVIVRVEECSHPIVMKGLCAECGQDLTQLQSTNGNQQTPISTATVSMVHSVPELMVSSEQAEQLGREDQQRLHRNKKLVLMVDLDQTLIHTTEQHCQRMSNKGIFHFQLGRGEPMLHTRLRPHCKEFLEKIAKLYELHVFTFGSRLYAHTIAGFLDPEKKLFSHRILSRDECIDPFSKTGNLRNLFPCGDSMVCIIDDREDVWKFAPNLITVKKYIYFQGTGDINAPPGSREAQMARKGKVPSGRQAENTDSAGTLGAEEHNNGLRKRAKDHSVSGKDEPTTSQSSQGAATNERTHPAGVLEEESGQSKEAVAEAGSKETQEGDRTNVKEDESNRTQEAQEGANSSAPSHESNNLDFDLSSDSDSDSLTEKPPSSESDSEGKFCQAKKPGQEGITQEPSDGDGAREGDSKSRGEGENSSDVAEPSGVLLPDPELGNGCSDRREPETESQNSEQSGVTMGEELLDQSMEDEEEEEEEEADNDQDDHLIYLEEVLERIHAEYYARYEAYLRKEASDTPDIRKIVPELKGKTLEGTMIVFSGLYPTNYPMERTREYYHAKALGAKIGKNLVLSSQDPCRTTHLIAARAGTEKVRQAQGCKHLYVVNPDWLWSCLERWERVEEQLYPLKEDYSKTPRSNSPAAFLDSQGSLQKPIFHPAPIHHRPPPPAPEVRTYDPVTGKLIRRGPQVSRPPPYLQASGSLLLSDHREQSCLRGTSKGQQDEAAGSSQDDEQPGPSRRKRQPSMSETMPLYTLCKEDLESMDKEVDDILGEESDNESEGRGKEKPGNEEVEDEDEEPQQQQQQQQQHQHQHQHQQQQQEQPGAGQIAGGGLNPQALSIKERLPTPSSEASLPVGVPRGHKRKHEEAKEEEDDDEVENKQSADESSKDSNEEEEGSSSEADEMAAALEAELNDFM
ncbi:LOW QUALITY PROTEIN: RNA polymerase II subunit A C-terminal domain phosphatase [Lates calcarifer]|uniref:RNA polymerase II subunit A C-terminal domain phosphatase n=1 Tax=Lates calcarifer TaxID=8187 RepID=A0AAJ7QIB0_LATCA|nr:LOW QUALITY PROTEIN: RNA polymerase II subunit A C-terminal domain phosphatase [Lates calcarifer]